MSASDTDGPAGSGAGGSTSPAPGPALAHGSPLALSPAHSPAIALDGVSVVRGGRLIWSEGTFEVPAGSITAVIGSNGAGKTTLLELVLGLIPPASGTVTVLGRPAGRGNERIGYVPQDYTSTSGDALRAWDAVLLGLVGRRWGLGRATRQQRDVVAQALREVDALDLAGARISQLSGGQRQRVAVAQALVSRPRLLVLDEPLANLDLRNQREIVTLLAQLNERLEVTIVVVAHDLNPLLPVLSGAIYLLDGHAHHDSLDGVVNDELLTHLYGTPVQVARTPQGDLFMRSM